LTCPGKRRQINGGVFDCEPFAVSQFHHSFINKPDTLFEYRVLSFKAVLYIRNMRGIHAFTFLPSVKLFSGESENLSLQKAGQYISI